MNPFIEINKTPNLSPIIVFNVQSIAKKLNKIKLLSFNLVNLQSNV